jgi:adenylylsulfate kinase
MKNKALVLWFTGLSGSGKTTIAKSIGDIFEKNGKRVLILDGDKIRDGRHKKLNFTPDDIRLNNSLIAKLCINNILKYDLILVPIISPYDDSRSNARKLIGGQFYEIYIRAPLEILKSRDTKGLYRLQQDGKIDNLIGVSTSNPYEPPNNPDLVIDTDILSLEESIKRLYDFTDSL